MHNRKITIETASEQQQTKCRKPVLRDHHQLMSPEEMTTDERWDRIVELLALMTAEAAP